MADLTAIILTKNEEKNITECISSIQKLAKRIIVIDSFSTDRTVELVKNLGAELYQHEFINYSKQFKYGLYNFGIETRWVLRIDADESLTEQSAAELEQLCNSNMNTDINGIVVRFEVNFMGKKLRHGGIYPFRKLIVFKHGIGDIEDRHMDEHIVLSSGKCIETKYDSIHRDYKDLTYFINKHNWYSGREVMDFFDNLTGSRRIPNMSLYDKIKHFIKFRIYYNLPIGIRAHFYYIYRYYFRMGFLDGKEGRIFAFLQAYWYRFLVDAKIYEKRLQIKNSGKARKQNDNSFSDH